MKAFWDSLGIATRLNILSQVMLVIVLSFAHFWAIEKFKGDILSEAEKRVGDLADGVINGMNTLMVSDVISNPANRRLFIAKMGASENVRELRIIRAKQVQDQFGIGLPEEQAKDDLDRRAIESRQPQFLLGEDQGKHTLRAVVPFIVSTNFRGTNCLTCHQVEVGSVNGAASIVLDITEEFGAIRHRNALLWLGQLGLQILLYFSIYWLIRRFLNPIGKLQSAMESMHLNNSMEQFVPIEIEKSNLGEISKLALAFNQMSEAIHNSKSLKVAASIFHSNTNAIVVTDEKNLIVDVNPAFTRITGYALDEVIGKDPKIFKSGIHDKEFYRKMWQSLLNQGSWEGEIWDKRKNGEIYPELAHFQVLRHADGSLICHVAQFTDLTEKKKKDELIFWQSNHDPLTSLPNRRLLNERLGNVLAASERDNFYGALMFLSVDEFNALNNTLGHEYGDMLILEVAKRLRSCVREVDTVARFGGGFVILIENVSEDEEDAIQQTTNIAEKIRADMAAPYQLGQIEYRSSSSIGVYLYDGKNKSVDDVLKRAYIAMHQAKDSGGNAVRFFDPNMQKLTRHFGRYEIIEEVGRGEMGVVYKARDPLIDRLVAIKTIDLKNLNKEGKGEYEARFYQEAKAAGRLNHPNIITIHDLGKSGDIAYIAMELMEGPELHDIITGNQHQPIGEKLDIAFQVAIGLAYAHQRGVVHRDIKPSNIMVLRDNHVKIADFGIAKMDTSGWRTQLGTIIGSPMYMSPEQVQSHSIDLRSDIFSLGIVLYQMLTGRHPFPGGDTNSIMYQIVNEAPQKPSLLNPEIIGVLDDIVLRCLAKKPEDRYQDANDLADKLHWCRNALQHKTIGSIHLAEFNEFESYATSVAQGA